MFSDHCFPLVFRDSILANHGKPKETLILSFFRSLFSFGFPWFHFSESRKTERKLNFIVAMQCKVMTFAGKWNENSMRCGGPTNRHPTIALLGRSRMHERLDIHLYSRSVSPPARDKIHVGGTPHKRNLTCAPVHARARKKKETRFVWRREAPMWRLSERRRPNDLDTDTCIG